MSKNVEEVLASGVFQPVKKELNKTPVNVIHGKIPLELNGTLFRNGPNPQFPDLRSHLFEGDGMIHALEIQDSHACYQNRWIETARFQAEKKFGRALFNTGTNPNDLPPEIKNISRGVANTNIVSHAGKLLALQETTPAIQIHPDSLNTLGEWNYDGKIPQMSAHPHIDPDTGNMHTYAYSFGSNDVTYYIISKEGVVIKSEKFTIPYSCMLHDFFITEHYAIFPIMPLTFNIDRAKSGGPILCWEPEKSAHIGIMPHSGTQADMIWLETDPFFSYHFLNAFEENGHIILDTMRANQADLFPDQKGKMPDKNDTQPYLTRYTMDLHSQQLNIQRLCDTICEFPRIDERFVGRDAQHGFFAATLRTATDLPLAEAIMHVDIKKRTSTIRDFGIGNIPGEPIFVPRNHDAAEGDGFLLTIVYDHTSDSSDLYILDAMHIDQDPHAILRLPQKVPFGFHGNWITK